jgi:hypothetical protein
LTFFEGYLTLDLDSADVFRGIHIFSGFFALKDFLSYRPLKKVWADQPTAVRFRVNCDPFMTHTSLLNGRIYLMTYPESSLPDVQVTPVLAL